MTESGTLALATRRQRAVLIAYMEKGSIKEAAASLGINENTARTRLHSFYKRAQVRNIAHAAYLIAEERRRIT